MAEQKEKTLFDNITDWFKTLSKEGVPTLLIGLGFILVLLSPLFLSSNPNFLFINDLIGAGMIGLGSFFHYKILMKSFEKE